MNSGECPWKRGSKRQRFYQPDWVTAPDCEGCAGCNGAPHRCHVFGIPGYCDWPGGLRLSNRSDPYWYPARDPGMAEKWLPPYGPRE